jgi:hypothetical protein
MRPWDIIRELVVTNFGDEKNICFYLNIFRDGVKGGKLTPTNTTTF